MKDPTEVFRMQWEMYEGSIALTQMAVVWKEVSADSSVQVVRKSDGAKTEEMIRIRRVWQLVTKGAALGIYDDEAGQLTNQFANMEVKNKAAKNGNEWFIGDVVPFERCAYIVNMNSDGSKKYYSF